ncbi:MAG: molybdopterin-binding protein [Brevefilum sp.]|nr:molybdopterin-binding protein [Brevefilum sp.]
MPTLEIITIGTELLLGEITDTNSTYIARTLRDHGIDIFRIITIGDNPARIASTIKESLTRADVVMTTGGLGPTVDDPTRLAVAKATDRELVFDPKLWEDILNHFIYYGRQPTENNRRQAFIPEGAIEVHNPVGTAPCFIVEVGDSCVISLPGVPREMEFILHESIIPYLSQKYVLKNQIIKATVLHAASIGESVIDEIIDDLEQMSNPTVGLLAHPGQVDIRVTTKAESVDEAKRLSDPIIQQLKSRLGENIYGQDEETLALIISRITNQHDIKLGILEYGLDGKFTERLKLGQPDQLHANILNEKPENILDFEKTFEDVQRNIGCDVWFGIAVNINEDTTAHLYFQNSRQKVSKTRKYGGPKEYIPLWAQNIGLDFLRRQLITRIKKTR